MRTYAHTIFCSHYVSNSLFSAQLLLMLLKCSGLELIPAFFRFRLKLFHSLGRLKFPQVFGEFSFLETHSKRNDSILKVFLKAQAGLKYGSARMTREAIDSPKERAD